MGSHVNGLPYLNDIGDYVTTYETVNYDITVNDARIYKNDATNLGRTWTTFEKTLILVHS